MDEATTSRVGRGGSATRRSRKRRRRERVHADVALDLVHRLADADGCREVDDGVDALERPSAGVADVAVDEGDLGGSRGLVAVDLRLEAVEDDDIVTAFESAPERRGGRRSRRPP